MAIDPTVLKMTAFEAPFCRFLLRSRMSFPVVFLPQVHQENKSSRISTSKASKCWVTHCNQFKPRTLISPISRSFSLWPFMRCRNGRTPRLIAAVLALAAATGRQAGSQPWADALPDTVTFECEGLGCNGNWSWSCDQSCRAPSDCQIAKPSATLVGRLPSELGYLHCSQLITGVQLGSNRLRGDLSLSENGFDG